MNNQKRLEELLEGIIVESTIQYLEAKEVSGGPDEQSQETHIEGVMVKEALVPELKLSVRSSKTFTCIQPAYRDHVESTDFEMASDIQWEFFQGDSRGDADEWTWGKAELINVLRSHTEMATFNPMLDFD
jgi:hypothetical protein